MLWCLLTLHVFKYISITLREIGDEMIQIEIIWNMNEECTNYK